jgi:hypothetical protein
MDRGYSAFGQALRSSFSLAAMSQVETEGLPSLALGLETPAELQEAWSGPRSPKPWRGRLGDGHELTIEWGQAGDLLFGYSGGARYRLDPTRAELGCAPEEPASVEWQRVLLSRVLPNVSLARGREALHACSVQTPGGVVAIAAPSGTGKSTLAVELMGRGARLFADDVLVLGRQGGEVEGHPGSPHVTLGPEAVRTLPPEQLGPVLASFSGEQWLEARHASNEACRVAAIVLLERAPGLTLRAEALSPSPLALAPHMLGLPDDESGREAGRFALYSDLVESATLLRLSADISDRPADLADTLEEALALRRPDATRAVA